MYGPAAMPHRRYVACVWYGLPATIVGLSHRSEAHAVQGCRCMWRRLLDCGGRASPRVACHWHASGSTGARVAYSHAQPTPPIPCSMHVTLGSEDSMRSIPLMAATTVILAAAWACGGDDGGTGPDADPVANFTGGPCTVAVPCSFADVSTDPDGENTITTRHWDFGD